jgi:hypothetical protein
MMRRMSATAGNTEIEKQMLESKGNEGRKDRKEGRTGSTSKEIRK